MSFKYREFTGLPSAVLTILQVHFGDLDGGLNRAASFLRNLDSEGFRISLKPDPRERVTRTYADGRVEVRTIGGEPVTVRVVTGDEVDPAPRVGTVALLTPEGERLIQALADEDYSNLSERQLADVSDLRDRLSGIGNLVFGVIERPITPEDFTGEAEPVKAAVRDKVAEAVREKLGEAIPGAPVFMHAARPFTDEDAPTVTVQPCPWVLKEVRPGKTEIGEVHGEIWSHEIRTSAKAVMVNMISGAEQEIQVEASGGYRGGSEQLRENVEFSVREAMNQARTAAAAFIAAMSPAPATAPGEAA